MDVSYRSGVLRKKASKDIRHSFYIPGLNRDQCIINISHVCAKYDRSIFIEVIYNTRSLRFERGIEWTRLIIFNI